MADQDEPKARYPRQDVNPGQEAGYIGEVETYDPDANGRSNSTNQSAEDVTPAEMPIVGGTGTIGGTTQNVTPKKG